MFSTIFLIIVGLLVLWQVVIRVGRKMFHFPAPAFIGPFLDSNFRRMMQPPATIIRRSGIAQGMHVLEVGCGSGAFTTFVARAVGLEGKVYALDIEPKMLAQLARKLQQPEHQDIKNIELVQGSAYALPFKENALDLAYMITVLQEIPDPLRACREIERVLKPGGILAVTEFWFDPDYPLRSTTVRIGKEAGFMVDDVAGSIWTYTVRFKKP
jgi:ubiquinone/menaquinone biosynthesis C-methylase UbiE